MRNCMQLTAIIENWLTCRSRLIEKMKRINYKLLLALLGLVSTLSMWADEAVEEQTNVNQEVELRTRIEFDKTWKSKYTLEVDEEVRTILGSSSTQYDSGYAFGQVMQGAPMAQSTIEPYFEKSYTTVSFSYKPIDYLSLGCGYTLKLYGNKGWTDPSKFIRHRFFCFVTPQVRLGQWKIALRERLDIDYRSDSVDRAEKQNTELSLRSRLRVDYTLPNKPLRLHLMLEVKNMLNIPTDYLNQCATRAGLPQYGQYVNYMHPELGLRWQIAENHSLNFYYRFSYIYSRDVDINRELLTAQVEHNATYRHIVGITYQFGN